MITQKVRVKKSKIHGKGLFASKPIKKGEVIWKLDRLASKVLTKSQFQRLPKYKQKLFYPRGDHYLLLGDLFEYINHSCDPNTWWLGDDTLIARRDIQKGEEITYDYATSEIDPHTMVSMRCNCSSKNCRKIITYKDCLNKKLQKIYKGHLPSWVVNFIKKKSTL